MDQPGLNFARIFAGLIPTLEEIRRFGVGGLCRRCKIAPFKLFFLVEDLNSKGIREDQSYIEAIWIKTGKAKFSFAKC